MARLRPVSRRPDSRDGRARACADAHARPRSPAFRTSGRAGDGPVPGRLASGHGLERILDDRRRTGLGTPSDGVASDANVVSVGIDLEKVLEEWWLAPRQQLRIW